MANEKRLIDPHDLWTDIMMLPHNGDMISSEGVEQAIKDAPTVDAVEVVRCKDCKHRGDYGCPMYHEEYIEWDDDGYHESEIINHDPTLPDGFCSYGERKGDGDDC